jgi:23S rRNA pseudouridine1911/1915/1917 synthase
MKPSESPTDPLAEPGRLDVVAARLSGIPRADIQRAIAAGLVLVDGEPHSKSYRLSGGERLSIGSLEPAKLQPEGPPVPIRYEDDDLLVVAKPAGILTHPTSVRTSGTLVQRLLGMGTTLPQAGDGLRPGIVHRLDKGTSGLLVVAKTDEAQEALGGIFRRHEAERRYLALVRGVPDYERFTVEAPLGRRAARIVVDRTRGREASTGFEVLEPLGEVALLEATPQTGRTHQIRVHLAAVGHPIVGDGTYGGGGEMARALGLDRPFLHAARLAFTHPFTGERIDLDEPLPPELDAALGRARQAASSSS